MGEPILQRPGDAAPFTLRFRMLALPTFGGATAIRVDVRTGGDAAVRAVRLAFAGSYGPGSIEEERSYSIGPADADALLRAIRRSRLRELSPTGRGRGDRFQCLDGTTYVFELASAASADFVTRHECDLGRRLRTLVSAVERLRAGAPQASLSPAAGPSRSKRRAGPDSRSG
jgi:hypothetical protein